MEDVSGITDQAPTKQECRYSFCRVCQGQFAVRTSAYTIEQDAQNMGDVPFLSDEAALGHTHTPDI